MTASAREYTGSLCLGDIGIPGELYHRLGLEVDPIFENDTIIPIEEES